MIVKIRQSNAIKFYIDVSSWEKKDSNWSNYHWNVIQKWNI